METERWLAELANEPQTRTFIGAEVDGIFTLLFALMALFGLVFAWYRGQSGAGRKTAVFTTVAGMLAAGVAAYTYSNVQGVAREMERAAQSGSGGKAIAADAMTVTIEHGLYISLLGSLVIVLAGLIGIVRGAGSTGQ